MALHVFPSFKEFYVNSPLSECDCSYDGIGDAKDSDMEENYPIEKQRQYVVGIEVRLIDDFES